MYKIAQVGKVACMTWEESQRVHESKMFKLRMHFGLLMKKKKTFKTYIYILHNFWPYVIIIDRLHKKIKGGGL